MPEFRARYEFKYLLRPEQEDWIRQVARMYSDPDPYGDNGVYDVCSMYYDTWDWKLALQTVEGVRNRMKVRIRTYGFTPEFPVFAEDKSRVGTSICKSRAQIPREHWAVLSRGEPPPAGGLKAAKPSHQPYYDRIRGLFDLLDLRPRLWVKYQREAYGSSYGDGARLTFDRFLRVQPPDSERIDQPDDNAWQRVQLDEPTILELKFNNAFPHWMSTIVHQMQLRRVSCSKYVLGVEQTGDVPWNRTEWSEAWTVY